MLEFIVESIKDFSLDSFGWFIFKIAIVLAGADLFIWIMTNQMIFDFEKIGIFGVFGVIVGFVGMLLNNL